MKRVKGDEWEWNDQGENREKKLSRYNVVVGISSYIYQRW